MYLRTFCRTFDLLKINSRFYKSAVSLDKLYPNSVNIQPFEPPKSEDGKFTGYIPPNDLKITYSCASGPGGQHVNKNQTKVDLRFHVESASWISEETRKKLLEQHQSKINKEGYFILKCDRTKFRHLNLADIMLRLRGIIFKLEEPEPEPDEETLERIRKNKEKSARYRLMDKRRLSVKRRQRMGEIY